MARKKTKPQEPVALVEPESVAAEPAFVTLLNRFALPLALLLLLIACARIVSTYGTVYSTADEPAHFACGMEYLGKHVYKLETQHPPLTRAMVALLPYLSGTRPRGRPNFQLEGWDLITYEHHPDRTLTLMRLGNLPFFLLGGMVVFLWGRRYFSAPVGLLATLLYTLLTPVLAHAGLATTDMGLAACVGAAFLSATVWAEEPTVAHAVVFGLCSALASVAKFTALGYYPLALVLAFLAWVGVRRPGWGRLRELARERAGSFGIALAVGVFVWWAAFFFSFGKVPAWKSNVMVPAPEFWDGIAVVLKHNADGHRAWLLGESRATGWWYFFPVALAVKTPLGFLGLLFVGLAVVWRQRRSVAYLLPVAFCLGILIPAMAGRINIGVRHILPIYLGFSVIAAVGLVRLIELRKWAAVVGAGLVLWCAAVGIVHHPDYIPYFNEIVKDPQDWILDSDYDWGQDLRRAAVRLKQLGAKWVNYGYIADGDHEFLQTFPGLPEVREINPVIPAEGWTLISPTMHLARQYGLDYEYPGMRNWFEYLGAPRERVGTLELYYVAPGSLNLPKRK